MSDLEAELEEIEAAERRLAERRRAIARLVAPQPIAQARPRSELPPPPPPRDDESGVFRLPVLQPDSLTREQLRSRRKREVRKSTENVYRLTKRDLLIGAALYPEHDDDPELPIARGDCIDGPRPCPFVSCKYHLFLDVNRNGSITYNFPDLEPDQLEHSCALDVADRRGETLENIGALMNLTRERVRQIEVDALSTIGPHLATFIDPSETRRPVRVVEVLVDRPDPEDTED